MTETRLQRIILVRHGETEGQSSIRYHGANDVPLSAEGRQQMRAVRLGLPIQRFDLVMASPLSRSWQGARIVAPGHPVVIEDGFREIDFGRWEGLTREEIAERDPELYRVWQEGVGDFDYPDGERRADFRERVSAGTDRLLARAGPIALVVVHKGIVRTVAERLLGAPLPDSEPDLGGVVHLRVTSSGAWRAVGR